jgi:hypothetical protein
MADGGKELHRRADGFVEDHNGNLACVMLTCKRKTATGHLFRFRFSPMGEVMNVEWPFDQILQIFPPEVTQAMLKRGHARAVTDDEIAAYEAAQKPQRKARQKPGDDDTVAGETDPLSEGVGLTDEKDEING